MMKHDGQHNGADVTNGSTSEISLQQPSAPQPSAEVNGGAVVVVSDVIFTSVPGQMAMTGQPGGARLGFAQQFDEPSEHIEIDLGYTIVYVLPDQLSKPSNRCLLACCPCMYGGLVNAVHTFHTSGMYKRFIFLISVAEVLIFAIEIIVNGGFESPSVNPLLGPSVCTLQRMQARFTSAIVHEKQVWRLVVPIFLHGGVIHLALNVYSQLCVGTASEYKWGTSETIFIYLLTGITGNLVSAVGNPSALSVGASGAIMGITGWQAAHLAVTWHHAEPRYRVAQLTGIVVALLCLVVIGAAVPDRIDNWTHGGGFVSGLVLGLVTFRRYLISDFLRRACLAAGLAMPLVFIWLLAYLFAAPQQRFVMEGCPLLPPG